LIYFNDTIPAQTKKKFLKPGIYDAKKHNATPSHPLTQENISHAQKNTVTTQKIQLFRRQKKLLAGAMESHQKNDTSALSWPF
jgi:hypothetical protein